MVRPSVNRKGPDRFRDVLHLRRAAIDELGRDLAADGASNGLRHQDAAGLGEGLQTRRDVDAIAVDRSVGPLGHVAEMHPDAKAHPPVFGNRRSQGEQRVLDPQRSVDGARCSLEQGKHRVARHVDYPPNVLRDLGAEHGAGGMECGLGLALVEGHEA